MKKEICCQECDTFFVISFKSGDPVAFCAFCGAEVIEEDTNTYVEDDE